MLHITTTIDEGQTKHIPSALNRDHPKMNSKITFSKSNVVHPRADIETPIGEQIYVFNTQLSHMIGWSLTFHFKVVFYTFV